MKILVTGGTGFAGSHLIEGLLAKGYSDVYSTCFSQPDGGMLDHERYLKVDLTDATATKQILRDLQPDWIFHLASFAYVGKSFEHANELFANNIGLQLSILEAVRTEVPHARVLTIGSAEEYGIVDPTLERIDERCELKPVNPYAITKVTQDLLAGSYFLSYGLDIVRARPFNHIGIRQTGDFAIPSFAQQIVAIERGEQETLHVGNLEGIRDFSDVKDMVAAYILLMERGVKGEIYNIGSGVGRKMSDVVSSLCSFSTAKIQLEQDSKRLRPLDVPRLVADNGKIVALGWQPTQSIDAALKAIVEEWRARSS